MASSEIEICNLALASVGESSIRSFDETNSRARMCKTFYNAMRDYLLSRFDWPFARRYKKLTEIDPESVDIPDGYRAFGIPSDCIAVRDIFPLVAKRYWVVSGSSLYVKSVQSFEEQLGIYFTTKEVQVAQFSDSFVNTLSICLAARLTPVLSQDSEMASMLYNQYQNEFALAIESDANIGKEFVRPDKDPNRDSFVYPGGLNIEDLDGNIFR